MRKRTQVRLKRLGQRMLVDLAPAKLCHPIFELAKYPVLCLAPQKQVVRQDHISQVINSAAIYADGNFLGMQRKLQFLAKKFLDRIKQVLQIFFVGRYDHEVVGVARVMFDFQLLLSELVEFVHVDVGKQLRSKVANRQTKMFEKRLLSSREAPNYQLYKPHSLRICNSLFENGQQNLMINKIKKLPHIAFKSIARNRIVSAFFPKHGLGGQYALVRAFADATGKRVGNKSLLKNRIQYPEHRMVQNTVSYCGFVNVANLRITNIEACIRSMGVFLNKSS